MSIEMSEEFFRSPYIEISDAEFFFLFFSFFLAWMVGSFLVESRTEETRPSQKEVTNIDITIQ